MVKSCEADDGYAKRYWEESGVIMVKCPVCGLVHEVVDIGGKNICVLCMTRAELMVPAGPEDCPVGCTLYPVNKSNFKGEGT